MMDCRRVLSWRKLILAFLFNLYTIHLHKTIGEAKLGAEINVTHAAVAADDERCSEIGKNVLLGTICTPDLLCQTGRRRGNAIDAAIATAFCLGVVSSASSGIGGGSFMVLRLANGTTKAFDMRETAPMAATKYMYYNNETEKNLGALSVAVPGQLAGLYKVWQLYGSFPWKELVMPSAILAEGYKISEYFHWEMELEKKYIFKYKGLRDIFTKVENGSRRLLNVNETCINKKLAETLKTIADEGIRPFYHGKIGENLIKEIQEGKGIMNMTDLNNYEVKVREPITHDILGMTIHSMPPPSAGGVGIVLLLRILEQYGVPIDVKEPLWVHRMLESMKHVMAVRLNIGDPDFTNDKRIVEDMQSPKFALGLQQAINDNKTFPPCHYGARWNQLHDYLRHENGTSHMSVIDEDGNAVAMTSTVNYHFGSKLLSESTGILLNNEMDDFCMPRKDPEEDDGNNNYIAGGKRPLSSMSPTIILKNNTLRAVVGGSGGLLIIPGVSEVIINLYAMDMNPNKSVNVPRVYHQLEPNVVHYENFTSVKGEKFQVDPKLLAALEGFGHKLVPVDSGTICQVVTLNEIIFAQGKMGDKKLMAVSDPRKGGVPAGY